MTPMKESEAVLEGHAESQIVEVAGQSVIVRVHADKCPCERCTRPVALYDLGDHVFVVELVPRLGLGQFVPWIDFQNDRMLGGTLVRAAWTDLIVEKIEKLYGKDALEGAWRNT